MIDLIGKHHQRRHQIALVKAARIGRRRSHIRGDSLFVSFRNGPSRLGESPDREHQISPAQCATVYGLVEQVMNRFDFPACLAIAPICVNIKPAQPDNKVGEHFVLVVLVAIVPRAEVDIFREQIQRIIVEHIAGEIRLRLKNLAQLAERALVHILHDVANGVYRLFTLFGAHLAAGRLPVPLWLLHRFKLVVVGLPPESGINPPQGVH
ncbi:MAG TPA: hypothetical protein VII20_16400 [Roseiarcus sp.]